MKRVICFDLWGTLVDCPSGNSTTYEDYLAEYWPRQTIQTAVRTLLMTNAWMSQSLCERKGDTVVSPTYPIMARMLIAQLPTIDRTINRDQLALAIAPLWENDNRQAEWMMGSQALLELLTRRGDVLVLITNTTRRGWIAVDRRLAIQQRFNDLFASCDQPFAKPDPRVWQWVMNRYSNAVEYWMIGNETKYDIAIPRTLGWKTLLVGIDGIDLACAACVFQG